MMFVLKRMVILCLIMHIFSFSAKPSKFRQHDGVNMEPRVLVIGRLQSTLDILVEEWKRYGRNVIASNSKEKIKEIIETDSIDFIAIGGGLPEDERIEMIRYINVIDSKIPVHPIPKTNEKTGPYDFIPFLNNHAIMFKVEKAMKK